MPAQMFQRHVHRFITDPNRTFSRQLDFVTRHWSCPLCHEQGTNKVALATDFDFPFSTFFNPTLSDGGDNGSGHLEVWQTCPAC